MPGSIPPAGVTPASAFVITRRAESSPVPVILADKIDPTTGDYASLVESATIADGLVVHLLRTTRDSGAAVLGLGQRFRSLRNVERNAVELIESMAIEALTPARDAGVVKFDRVESEVEPTDGSQTNTGIRYMDLLAPPSDRERVFELPT